MEMYNEIKELNKNFKELIEAYKDGQRKISIAISGLANFLIRKAELNSEGNTAKYLEKRREDILTENYFQRKEERDKFFKNNPVRKDFGKKTFSKTGNFSEFNQDVNDEIDTPF
jgi:vacuolar-type H+-ATPase subunit H